MMIEGCRDGGMGMEVCRDGEGVAGMQGIWEGNGGGNVKVGIEGRQRCRGCR